MKRVKEKLVSFMALFTSTGTLLCCAIPASIALLAGASAITSYIAVFPWVIPLSRHKAWIFLGAGLSIALNAVFILRPKGRLACGLTGGKGCEAAGRFSKFAFWLGLGIYAVGVFMTYGIVPVLEFLER